MITVYQFTTPDTVTGQIVAQPVKSTAERIGRIPGAKIINGSGEKVSARTVDADGRRKFHQ